MNRFAALALITPCLWAADFQTGQAARAVIGQNSFTARSVGFTPTALALSGSSLYAADSSHRLLTFDLSAIPGARDEVSNNAESACPVCGFPQISSVAQAVLPGIAAAASFGKTAVIADTVGHRVLIWRDTSSPRAAKGPDVVLGKQGGDNSVVSAATLSEPISVAFDGKRLFVGDGALRRVLIWNSLPVSDNQPADVVLGQQSFTSVNLSDAPGPDTISRPTALVSDGNDLFVADSLYHRILIFTAGDTPLRNSGVVNSATMVSGLLAPGTLINISGRELSNVTESAPEASAEALPETLGGVEVYLDGQRLPLLSISPEAVRAQLPYETGDLQAGSLYVRTQRGDGTVAITNAVAVKLSAAAPGLFTMAGAEPRIAMALHTDPASGQASGPVTSDDPAKPGELLVLWATGLGAVNDDATTGEAAAGVPYEGPDANVTHPVASVVSGRTAQVTSAMLPHGSIGIYEVRIQLPADLPTDANTPLLIMQDTQVSNTVTIPVENVIH